MTIETPFAKKVPRFQDSDDGFLAPLRHHGEFDPTLNSSCGRRKGRERSQAIQREQFRTVFGLAMAFNSKETVLLRRIITFVSSRSGTAP
jgi:hypothetical protein